MNAPDTAHQLDAEVVVAEVAYTMTNTQPSCSGGGESDRILNTLKEAMDLPQAARFKEHIGQGHCESRESRRLRPGTDCLSPRGTQGC